MAGFRRKPISPAAVLMAEASAANSPIVGDPRMSPVLNLGSSQDASSVTKSVTPAPVKSVKSVAAANIGSSQDLALTGGGVVHAPLSKVKSNPFNPRAVYTNTAVESMAVSLSQHGQRVAALGYIEDDGSIVLIEGETRLRGARAAGLETLRIELRPKPKTDRELYEMARAANVERRDQTPIDDALRWKEMLAKGLYPTQSALAKAMEVGEDLVSRTLSLASLPQKIILQAAETPELLSLKMLNAIREFCVQQGEEETIELIHEVVKNGLGYRDVVARRKSAEKGPVKRPRAARESFKFGDFSGEIKIREEGGRMDVSLKNLTPEQLTSVADSIKRVLAEA